MRFEFRTHLSPEEVISRAETFYAERTGLQVDDSSDNRLELSGTVGVAKISAHRAHGHTMVLAETDRGVGLDVTDQTLRFLYSLPHI